MPYLRTTLAAGTFFLTFVLAFGNPASGQTTAREQGPAAPRVQETTTSALHNGKIVFVSDRDGGAEVFAKSQNGKAVTQLTNKSEAYNVSPSWNSDGTEITFVRTSPMPSIPPEIFRMNADGSDQVRLRTVLTDTLGSLDLDWSPDGSKVAFVRHEASGDRIYTANADGTHEVQLGPVGTYGDYNPDWSPGGSKIAFIGSGPAGDQIYTANADGTGLTQLTDSSWYTHQFPDWSPDGSKIVFIGYDRRTGDRNDVFVMNSDGSGVKNLTNEPNFHDFDAVWSPEGREIAFVRDEDGDCGSGQDTCDIWLMKADGSSPTRITSNPANDFAPAWQPLEGGGHAHGNGDRSVIPGATTKRPLSETGGPGLVAPTIGLLLISGLVARSVVRRR